MYFCHAIAQNVDKGCAARPTCMYMYNYSRVQRKEMFKRKGGVKKGGREGRKEGREGRGKSGGEGEREEGEEVGK